MKKILKNINVAIISCLGMATVLSGCSDQFLKDKDNYSAQTASDIYASFEGAEGRVDYLYYILLPDATASVSYSRPSSGVKDIFSACTEEYGGLSSSSYNSFINSTTVLDNTTVPDFIYNEVKINRSPYGFIRQCNDVIEGVEDGDLTEDEKEELLGQAYFFRAWVYYRLVQNYGGVPIVDYVQDALAADAENLVVARSTTKECIDFICSDLEKAASYLPLSWDDSDYGRITSGAALALAGRARLLYASPLFNRADDTDRWTEAYEENKAAIDSLTAGGFGLAYLDDPGTNGSGWAAMFSDYQSSEAVFVTLYNNIVDDGAGGTTYYKNNAWENKIRPANTNGGGGISTTAQMIDMFPMSDGKVPSSAPSTVSSDLSVSDISYSPSQFFINRDPRFYRTFAFPGEKWSFDGTPDPDGTSTAVYPYSDGHSYELWSYCWYADEESQESSTQSGFAADGLGADDNTSIFIRKRTDDYDVNSSDILYTYQDITENAGKGFSYSGAPYMEIRYAEVLLNYAESACGAGYMSEAVEALKEIRQRAGISAGTDGMYGLDTDLSSDRAKCFAAILYERQIELAYEGKRFDDMRRWLLFDGGANFSDVEDCPSDWLLTGFDGNTCTYLGVSPMNGQRRTGIEIDLNSTLGQYTEANGYDPIESYRPDPLDLSTDSIGPDDVNLNNMYNLVSFYSSYLNRKTIEVDGTDTDATIDFQPNYYLLGFIVGMQSHNTQLKQTIGWADYENGGANGTFDPLAE